MSLKDFCCVILCILAVNASLVISVVASTNSCSPWYYYDQTNRQCLCGFNLVCNGNQVQIKSSICTTCSEGENGSCYIAKCPFHLTSNVVSRMFSQMPSNASQLDELMCGPYKRKGFLCSECGEGYGPAIYSIDMRCADCSSLRSGYAISLYLLIHTVPMTLIFILLMIFNFNITSGPLLGYAIFCQISLTSVTNRNSFIYNYLQSNMSTHRWVLDLSITLSQFWSLQFFQGCNPTVLYE